MVGFIDGMPPCCRVRCAVRCFVVRGWSGKARVEAGQGGLGQWLVGEASGECSNGPPLLLPAPLPRFLLLPATACPPATGTATAPVPPSLSRLGLPPLTLPAWTGHMCLREYTPLLIGRLQGLLDAFCSSAVIRSQVCVCGGG